MHTTESSTAFTIVQIDNVVAYMTTGKSIIKTQQGIYEFLKVRNGDQPEPFNENIDMAELYRKSSKASRENKA